MNAAAFVLAVGVPIFSDIVSLAASLFASWFTYGLVGAFWLFDAYNGLGGGTIRGVYGFKAWTSSPRRLVVNVLTLLAGLFICVAGKLSILVPVFHSTASTLRLDEIFANCTPRNLYYY